MAAAVPEPATWAMMLVGFAMVGGTVRYRRRGVRLAYR
ncbi:PEPxxWA-CTERM sorting domain-containing protein [Sphingomonas sp. BT553]|uniref:PEPxxWA-CTERM sorting domain-containing protein n=2 Tax=Sphingomonas mollis TaxID=2795726 RepID=A0ABS0XP56_9SPHN|nr:PEPxxWA-CTERM sorting domain-containing protein [Sphingomonas sp. BT553]